MTYTMRLTRAEWDGICDQAADHYEKVKDWSIGAGNYAPSLRGVRVGHAGEFAVQAWLSSLPVHHEPDHAEEWGWDRVTHGATIEVKARQAADDLRWPRRINVATVSKIRRGSRKTVRRGQVFLWAVTYGDPMNRIHEVRLNEWTVLPKVVASPRVQEEVGRTGKMIWNYEVPERDVYPLDTLADLLVKYDGQMVS